MLPRYSPGSGRYRYRGRYFSGGTYLSLIKALARKGWNKTAHYRALVKRGWANRRVVWDRFNDLYERYNEYGDLDRGLKWIMPIIAYYFKEEIKHSVARKHKRLAQSWKKQYYPTRVVNRKNYTDSYHRHKSYSRGRYNYYYSRARSRVDVDPDWTYRGRQNPKFGTPAPVHGELKYTKHGVQAKKIVKV